MRKIVPPKNCPSCNTELVWRNNQLYCTNSECGTKIHQKMKHFAISMKIKGLGPVTIKKLGLTNISQLYEYTEDQIAEILNSDRLAEKLIYEIENSKKASLNLLLPAFSIPLVGKTASEKLSTVCESIFDITETNCRQAGLGPKCTKNLLDWLQSDFPLVKDLPFNFEFEKVSEKETKGVVCLSGRLKSYPTKGAAKFALEDSGYKVVDNFTKQVTILVNESGIESSKTKKARTSGIPVVTNLTDLIGETNGTT
jgi:NAD-dependent DNA ligase